MAENVVIVASQKRPLGGRELQLPSMSMLTSKTSTQKFFLRVLQVIIQLRDDTRRANKKAKQTGRLGMELECPIEKADDGGCAGAMGLGVVVVVDPESLEEQG